jgi:AraC-like DNA-binding protein
MLVSDPFSISIRSYGAGTEAHRHDFAQLVLPLEGSLSIEIAGREDRIDRNCAAYVAPGTRHAQESRLTNRFLILDFDASDLDRKVADRLASGPFIPLVPEANYLIDYMGSLITKGASSSSKVGLWTPLLLDALLGDKPQPHSRLGGLLAVMDANPFENWTANSMAARVNLSVSRLHALFREELDTTPRAWLSNLRLSRVCQWLATTDLPIADLAYRSGYADQSALTRAMRKATGLTPAAYRRRARETRHKEQ